MSYGKRKIKEISTGTHKTVTTILDIDETALTETTSTSCCKSRNDLNNLIVQIKSKFDQTLSKSEKISLLTLAPGSWTIEET